MKSRSTDRIRYSTTFLEILPTERSGRSRRGFSLEVSSSVKSCDINQLDNKQLIKAIHEIK